MKPRPASLLRYTAELLDALHPLADRLDGNTINATDPDLKAFVERGGKLLLYHGWGDVAIAPRSTVTYYDSVVKTVGALRAQNSVRLFMVPGMGHGQGLGDGPSMFDPLAALEDWVEHGKAPDQIIASRITSGSPGRTRPLCPYPQVAAYKGTGSTDAGENYACKTPEKKP